MIYKDHLNREFRHNDVVECTCVFLPRNEAVGRLLQVRRGKGQFGSDIFLVRRRDGSLMSFENVGLQHASDDIPINGDDTLDVKYTLQGQFPECGFIVDEPKKPAAPSQMRLVFLDIDGVLAPFSSFGASQLDRYVCHDIIPKGVLQFEPSCVAELNAICEGGKASVVVSSSWRGHIRDLELMRKMLNAQGVMAPVIGMTPIWDRDIPGLDQSRGGEIRYFMEPLDVESFVILDDCDMGFVGLEDRWVKTNSSYGLLRNHTVDAINLLNTPIVERNVDRISDLHLT